MGTIRKFDWEKWENLRLNCFESRMPTENETETLIRMFEECPWCIIRDILIDSGLTDESFPIFWYDVMDKKLKTSKGQL